MEVVFRGHRFCTLLKAVYLDALLSGTCQWVLWLLGVLLLRGLRAGTLGRKHRSRYSNLSRDDRGQIQSLREMAFPCSYVM